MNFKTTLATLFIFIFIFINNCATANTGIENISNEEILPNNKAAEDEILIVASAPNTVENYEMQLVINAQQEELQQLKTEMKLLKESINDIIAYCLCIYKLKRINMHMNT